MSGRLVRACDRALRHNLDLSPGERVRIITDSALRGIGDAFGQAARRITDDVALIEIPVGRRNGEEPPEDAARAMARSDVALLPLARSISWTRTRHRATAAGARIASMPGITEEILLRSAEADYDQVRVRVNRLADLLDDGREVRIRSAAGTDLLLGIDGRLAHGRKGGLYREAGHWGNLPCGEAFIAPVEGTARGLYVVDASQAGAGPVTTPIRIEVEAGRAVAIHGGTEAARLRETLDSAGDRNVFNVAELGIGCNDAARVSGVTLEDEKALGTCHVALGSNAFFGGEVRVDLHLDGVIRKPTIIIDGATVLEFGRIVAGG